MAQLVERVLGKDEVTGSNPVSSSKESTSFNKGLVDFLFDYGLCLDYEKLNAT